MKRGFGKILGYSLGLFLASKLCFGDTIDILSGTDGNGNPGNPGSLDQIVKFDSENIGNESKAYIGVGAQNNPSLTVDKVGSNASQSITTTDTDDRWGRFYFDFNLPNGFSNPRIDLDIFLDDGGLVYLNNNNVAMIDLVECPKKITVTNNLYFKTGNNTLMLYVVNTGDGHYGVSKERTSTGDAMYVEFDGSVTYSSASTIKTPVLLVHGYQLKPSSSNPEESFGNLKTILKNDGIDAEFLDYSSASHNYTIEQLATVFGVECEKVKSKYNAPQVDVVAHSMAGLLARAYISGMASNRSYNNEIRRLIMAGTPNYGAKIASLWSILFTDNNQVNEMSFGSLFLWNLHYNWNSSNFTRSNSVVIAGIGTNASGQDDSIVQVENAYLNGSEIRYVPYNHFEIMNVDDASHKSYLVIKSFLESGTLPSQSTLTPTNPNPTFAYGSVLLGATDSLNNILNANVASPIILKNYDSNLFYAYDTQPQTYNATISCTGYRDKNVSLNVLAGKNLVQREYLEITGSGGDGDGDDGGGGSSGSSSGGGGGCFIATAAYGSPLAKEVVVLSRFRDEHLLTNQAGKMFVSYYYKYGPYVADYIKDKEVIKKIARDVLKPIVWVMKR